MLDVDWLIDLLFNGTSLYIYTMNSWVYSNITTLVNNIGIVSLQYYIPHLIRLTKYSSAINQLFWSADEQRANRLIAKFSSKFFSADNTINVENQSSNMVERRRFLIIRTRLIALSELQLVMASDSRMLYRQVKLGHPAWHLHYEKV